MITDMELGGDRHNKRTLLSLFISYDESLPDRSLWFCPASNSNLGMGYGFNNDESAIQVTTLH
jgi:hypothetical protein